MWKLIWRSFCAVVGAAIGAILLGTYASSMLLAVVGGLVGAGLGALFGKYIHLGDVLS